MAEPIVKYEFIRMPDSTGFGDYTETGQVIPVRFNGEEGGFGFIKVNGQHSDQAEGALQLEDEIVPPLGHHGDVGLAHRRHGDRRRHPRDLGRERRDDAGGGPAALARRHRQLAG